MKLYCIACGVFRKDLERLSPGFSVPVTIEYLEGGLHTNPGLLRKELQKSIDRVPPEYDRIILLYGTCGKGVVGLSSPGCELVIPRVHDCISLFLGGTGEYLKQFTRKPGTYYISAGWYEEQVQPRGKQKSARFPAEYVDTTDKKVLRERFGDENAREISEFFDSWQKNYSRAVYIHSGTDAEARYEAHARNMAEQMGWEYTRLEGSDDLISRCFEPAIRGEDILIVPRGRKTVFDTVSSSVAVETDSAGGMGLEDRVLRDSDDGTAQQKEESRYSLGLGIDAGGTYTDAVLFSFEDNRVLAKSKALTTKWQYSQGIMEAVRSLSAESLAEVDLISLSTTLVTNAIVESNTQPVGLFVMPPGKLGAHEIDHSPFAVVKGRMSIDGTLQEPADPDEIRQKALDMVRSHGVKAFAVSGYGGSVNPVLELQVKEILRETTGLDVCCGHELSGSLNFYVRARTAVLNAGTIPIMEEFLSEMRKALSQAGLRAPLLVVRGDGSVMTGEYASDFPVQTALSGPAASMAGARYLEGLENALVADVGGTTTDIGFLSDGRVNICDDGARIGDWMTHVRAVDMTTVGLGGDSEILFDSRQWLIGPRRITPFVWLDNHYDLSESFEFLSESAELPEENMKAFQWLCLTGKEPDFELTRQESRIMELLSRGPFSVRKLGFELAEGVWKNLRTERLENSCCLLRSGLTPTDLFHLEGTLSLWKTQHLAGYFSFISRISGLTEPVLLTDLKTLISRKAGGALLGRIFPDHSDRDQQTLLDRGNSWASVRLELNVPVVGLGASAGLLLKDGTEAIGGTLILPEHGDVANAVGAVTSLVSVSLKASILPTPAGFYRITGPVIEHEDFERIEEAEEQALVLLRRGIIEKARAAGTSSRSVRITISNKTAETAGGDLLFLERILTAQLEGIPDLV